MLIIQISLKKKGFPKHRADIATEVRDFFPNIENFL